MKTLGQRIKGLRERKNLSVTELAMKMDVSEPTIYRLEDLGTDDAKLSYLIKINEVFNLSPDEFYFLATGDDEKLARFKKSQQVAEQTVDYCTSSLGERLSASEKQVSFLQDQLSKTMNILQQLTNKSDNTI